MSLIGALFTSGSVHSIKQVWPDAQDQTSPAMSAAIADWFHLYYADEEIDEEDPCQRLPATVVSKLHKACFAEYSAKLESKGDPTPNDKFYTSCLKSLSKRQKKAVQLGMIGGECWLKPIIGKKSISWTVVRRDAVMVLARDGDDQVTDLVSFERTHGYKKWYTLLERRTVNDDGYLTIRNRLFCSKDAGAAELGTEVSLAALPKYEVLEPEYTFPVPVFSIGLASVRMPLENTVDGSSDAVSVYAPADRLIHRINHNEWLLNQEFDLGATRVFASEDLMRSRRDPDGNIISRRLPPGLFTGLDDNPESTGVTIFSPALREESYLARKNEYLRNVESLIGIKRGLLCDVAEQQRTATEVNSSAGDYSLTVQDLQEIWESAVREALRLCSIFGPLYHLVSSGAYDSDRLSVDWGNGVLYDRSVKNKELLAQVSAGILKPEIYIAWYYDLPWETPEDLATIREKYMPEIEQLLEG